MELEVKSIDIEALKKMCPHLLIPSKPTLVGDTVQARCNINTCHIPICMPLYVAEVTQLTERVFLHKYERGVTAYYCLLVSPIPNDYRKNLIIKSLEEGIALDQEIEKAMGIAKKILQEALDKTTITYLGA